MSNARSPARALRYRPRAAAADPVAGSSCTPTPGANPRAFTFVGATGAKQQLTVMIKQVPKAMQAILKGVNITSIGPEAVVSASIADQKSTDLMKLFDKIF